MEILGEHMPTNQRSESDGSNLNVTTARVVATTRVLSCGGGVGGGLVQMHDADDASGDDPLDLIDASPRRRGLHSNTVHKPR